MEANQDRTEIAAARTQVLTGCSSRPRSNREGITKHRLCVCAHTHVCARLGGFMGLDEKPAYFSLEAPIAVPLHCPAAKSPVGHGQGGHPSCTAPLTLLRPIHSAQLRANLKEVTHRPQPKKRSTACTHPYTC